MDMTTLGLVMNPAARDSWLIELACIGAGLNTLRTSQNMVIGLSADLKSPVPFRNTASVGTSVIANRTASDRLQRRYRLEEAGLRLPRSRAFRWNDRDNALAYAEHLGYPVVIKTTQQAPSARAFRPCMNAAQARKEIGRLRQANPKRHWKVRRASHLLVEEYVPGKRHEFYVVGDEVRAVVSDDGGAGTHWTGQAVHDEVHFSFHDYARNAVQAMPWLDHALVVIHADDVTIAASAQSHCLVSISLNPSFWRSALPESARVELATALVQRSVQLVGGSCTAEDPRGDTCVELRLDGTPDVHGVHDHLRTQLASWGSTVEFEVLDSNPLRCRVRGPVPQVVTLPSLAFAYNHPVSFSELIIC